LLFHVISESKIRPSITEIGDFEASRPACRFRPGGPRANKLACVVPGGREYWRQQKREEWMNRLIRAFGVAALFFLAATASGRAEPVLPVAAAPEDVGLSSSQLARIEALTQKYVDSGRVP